MNTQNFQSLIQAITGRQLVIQTNDSEIIAGKEYYVYKHLPLTDRKIYFKWKAALTDEKLLRSFITAFTTKYREPNPAAYRTCAPYFSPSWDEMPPLKQEYAYMHHSSNMYGKEELMKQIERNFEDSNMTGVMIRYGFYPTEYGIGIFSLFASESIIKAIQSLKDHLNTVCIPYTNEFSDARWVYRFKLNISKESHVSILNSFNQ